MANHKSALKRARQNEIRRLRNMGYKTKVKKAIREVRTAVANDSAEDANVNLRKAVSILQKSVSKGTIHRKRASRKISRLSRQVNQTLSS